MPVDSELDSDAESIPGGAFQELQFGQIMLPSEPTTYRMKLGRHLWKGSFSLAGLSMDCRFAYFCRRNELKIHFTGECHPSAPQFFNRQFQLPIRSVTCTQHFVLVTFGENVTLCSIDQESGVRELSAHDFRSWILLDAAMIESGGRLFIVLIQHSLDGESRIAVYDFATTENFTLAGTPPEVLTWFGSSRPKQIAVSSDGQVVGCIGTKGEEHHVLVWRRTHEFRFEGSPILLTSYQFTRVSPPLWRPLYSEYLVIESLKRA